MLLSHGVHRKATIYSDRVDEASSNRDDTRQGRRKAATRHRILDAADAVFAKRGYAETSLEQIADAADVAVRTIYLHFPSKAALLLAYFDNWLDAFVETMSHEPIDLPIEQVLEATVHKMSDGGWIDRPNAQMSTPYPVDAALGAGSPELAGHVMNSWVRALECIAADMRRRGSFPPGSPEPEARAAVFFGTWIATVLAARQSRPSDETGNDLGLTILGMMTKSQH